MTRREAGGYAMTIVTIRGVHDQGAMAAQAAHNAVGAGPLGEQCSARGDAVVSGSSRTFNAAVSHTVHDQRVVGRLQQTIEQNADGRKHQQDDPLRRVHPRKHGDARGHGDR